MGEETAATIKETVYDQKAFIQVRLHELFLRINRLSAAPFIVDNDSGVFNYQIIFNDLCSILSTIWSKLTPDEKKLAKQIRENLGSNVNKNVSVKMRHPTGRKVTAVDINLRKNIANGIFEFRCLLEEAMNLHGFNPDKDDLSKAIIKW